MQALLRYSSSELPTQTTTLLMLRSLIKTDLNLKVIHCTQITLRPKMPITLTNSKRFKTSQIKNLKNW
jgi:hypothetical protein